MYDVFSLFATPTLIIAPPLTYTHENKYTYLICYQTYYCIVFIHIPNTAKTYEHYCLFESLD